MLRTSSWIVTIHLKFFLKSFWIYKIYICIYNFLEPSQNTVHLSSSKSIGLTRPWIIQNLQRFLIPQFKHLSRFRVQEFGSLAPAIYYASCCTESVYCRMSELKIMRWQKNCAADISGQHKDFVVHPYSKYIFSVMNTGFPCTQSFTGKFIAGNSVSVIVVPRNICSKLFQSKLLYLGAKW